MPHSPTLADDKDLVAASSAGWLAALLPALGLCLVVLGTPIADLSLGFLDPDAKPAIRVMEGPKQEAEAAPVAFGWTPLRDGSWSASVDTRAKASSPTRKTLAPRFALARWRALGIASDTLLAGREDWLFLRKRAEPPKRLSEERLAGVLATHRALARRFEAFGHRLAFMLLPTKATAAPERLVDPGLARTARYEQWVDQMRAQGLLCFETLKAIRDLPIDQRWQPRDTHWSPQAQARVAQSLAPQLRPFLPRIAQPWAATLGPEVDWPRSADLLRLGGMLPSDSVLAPDYASPAKAPQILAPSGEGLTAAPRFESGSLTAIPAVITTGTSFVADRPFAAYLAQALQLRVADAAKPGTGPERPLLALLPAARALGHQLPTLVLVDLLQHLRDDGIATQGEVVKGLASHAPANRLVLGTWTRDGGASAPSFVELVAAPEGKAPRQLIRTRTGNDVFCDGSGLLGYSFTLGRTVPGERIVHYSGEPWPKLNDAGGQLRFTLPILRRHPDSYSALSVSKRLLAQTQKVELTLDVSAVDPRPLDIRMERPTAQSWRLTVTLPYVGQPQRKSRAPAVLLRRAAGPPSLVDSLSWVYEDGHSVVRTCGPAGNKWIRIAALAPPNRSPVRPVFLIMEGRGRPPLAAELTAVLVEAARP